MSDHQEKDQSRSTRSKLILVVLLSLVLGYVVLRPSADGDENSRVAGTTGSPKSKSVLSPPTTRHARNLHTRALTPVDFTQVLAYNPFEFDGKRTRRSVVSKTSVESAVIQEQPQPPVVPVVALRPRLQREVLLEQLRTTLKSASADIVLESRRGRLVRIGTEVFGGRSSSGIRVRKVGDTEIILEVSE